jgi:hypothetical protein
MLYNLDGWKVKESLKKQIVSPCDDINPRWLSVSQACKYASMSRPTLMNHILNGNFYAKKDGKWRVDRYSIDTYLLSDNDDEIIRKILAGMKTVDR